jgi:hypothetical protein
MNPPEKYLFLGENIPPNEYYVPIFQRCNGMLAVHEGDMPRPLPYIVAVYKWIGKTDKGHIYEYDGLEIR